MDEDSRVPRSCQGEVRHGHAQTRTHTPHGHIVALQVWSCPRTAHRGGRLWMDVDPLPEAPPPSTTTIPGGRQARANSQGQGGMHIRRHDTTSPELRLFLSQPPGRGSPSGAEHSRLCCGTWRTPGHTHTQHVTRRGIPQKRRRSCVDGMEKRRLTYARPIHPVQPHAYELQQPFLAAIGSDLSHMHTLARVGRFSNAGGHSCS